MACPVCECTTPRGRDPGAGSRGDQLRKQFRGGSKNGSRSCHAHTPARALSAATHTPPLAPAPSRRPVILAHTAAPIRNHIAQHSTAQRCSGLNARTLAYCPPPLVQSPLELGWEKEQRILLFTHTLRAADCPMPPPPHCLPLTAALPQHAQRAATWYLSHIVAQRQPNLGFLGCPPSWASQPQPRCSQAAQPSAPCCAAAAGVQAGRHRGRSQRHSLQPQRAQQPHAENPMFCITGRQKAGRTVSR